MRKQLIERNKAIAQDLINGMSVADASAKHGLSVATIRVIAYQAQFGFVDDLNRQLARALKAEGRRLTVSEIRHWGQKTDEDLLGIRGFGKKSLSELRRLYMRFGKRAAC